MRAEMVVEGYAGDIGVGVFAGRFFPVVVLGGRDGHCECCAVDKDEWVFSSCINGLSWLIDGRACPSTLRELNEVQGYGLRAYTLRHCLILLVVYVNGVHDESKSHLARG